MILIAPLKSISDENKQKIEPPPGRVITEKGTQYKAYTLEEYRQIANIFIDYSTLFEIKKLKEEQREVLKEKEELLERKVEIWQEESLNQETRAEMWLDLYEEQREINSNILQEHKKTTWIPWALVGVLGLTTGALGIVIGVTN